tara:strand:- start:126 stop:845 length:720 start_codon:yes stop_codon:yes gene_type:complete
MKSITSQLLIILLSSSLISFSENLKTDENFSKGLSKIIIARTCKFPTSAYTINFYINDNEQLAKLKCNPPKKLLSFEHELNPGEHNLKINYLTGLGKNRKVLVDYQGNSWEAEKKVNLSQGQTRYFVARWFQDQRSGAGNAFGLIGAAIEQAVEGVSREGLFFEEQSADCVIKNKGKNCLPFEKPQVISTPIQNITKENVMDSTALSVEEQLVKLKKLFDAGLISKEVYEAKQKDLLGL